MEEWILKRTYLDYKEVLKDFPIDEITAKLISKKKFTNKREIYSIVNSNDAIKLAGEVTISTVTKDERKTRNETPLTAIGDTVFLSKEDAEIKLKEMRR